jgi:GTP-binding protein EngB required for normal cell division
LGDQKWLKSEKDNVNEQLATESHQLQQHKIDTIQATMQVLVYKADKVATSKCRQFQVHLNRAQQAATNWSEVDHTSNIAQFQCEIHQIIAWIHELFDILMHHVQ